MAMAVKKTHRVTMKEIVDFAASRPRQRFDVCNMFDCLVCQLVMFRDGVSVMYQPGGSFRSLDSQNSDLWKVPRAFTSFCLEHPEGEDGEKFTSTGAEIVRAMKGK